MGGGRVLAKHTHPLRGIKNVLALKRARESERTRQAAAHRNDCPPSVWHVEGMEGISLPPKVGYGCDFHEHMDLNENFSLFYR